MDASYILALQSDNEACFEEMYYFYNQNLYAYFYKHIREETICEDLVQETFIRLWRHRKHLDPHLSLPVQIFRIAKTALIDVARRRARRPDIGYSLDSLPELCSEDDALNVNEEKREQLLGLITTLPPVRKKILHLRINGYSNKEIASTLKITVKTVENNMNLAYRELRKLAQISPILLFVLLK